MRETWPSFTAMVVSAMRGVSRAADDAIDPVAARLLPGPVAALVRGSARSSLVEAAVRRGSLGLLDHIALRTLAIDEALRNALAAGADQVVLLGAGLDARAHRLGELEGVAVFEVDHPATQAYKRARAAALPPRPRLTYVAVDFEREALGERLAAAGHDAARPSVWIWEGVTMYLDVAAVRATVADVAARSPAGSTLLLTYVTPDRVSLKRLVSPLAEPVLRLLGEPLGATFTPAALATLLAERGFEVESDRGVEGWARDLRRGRRGLLTLGERLAIARTTGASRPRSGDV